MMHVIFFCLLIVNSQDFLSVKSDRISSKLDFGDDTERIITIKNPEKLTNFEISKPEGTTVVCSSSGCNKTEARQDDIVSDVLVHVKTSVNVPKAKNETIEETPDIPVVLGYGRNNPHPQYNPDNLVKTKPAFTGYERNNPDNLVNTNPVVIGYERNNPDNLVNTNPVVIGYERNDPESLINTNPIVSSAENNIPQNTFVPIYRSKPQSSRKFYNNNFKQVSYDTMLHIPYIEPSFHNYHYGEQPPLQYVWMPKESASFNPVEFKRFERPVWSKTQFSQWNSRPVNPSTSQGTTTGGYTMCTCHNPGLNWYPTIPTWNIQSRNVNSNIDDKLAPLN